MTATERYLRAKQLTLLRLPRIENWVKAPDPGKTYSRPQHHSARWVEPAGPGKIALCSPNGWRIVIPTASNFMSSSQEWDPALASVITKVRAEIHKIALGNSIAVDNSSDS